MPIIYRAVGLVFVFCCVAVEGNESVSNSSSVVALNSTMEIICQTLKNYTSDCYNKAHFKILHNDNVLVDRWSNEVVDVDNLILNHDEIVKNKRLQLELTIKNVQFSDAGVNTCIVHNIEDYTCKGHDKITSERTVTVVEVSDEVTFVQQGDKVPLSCVTNASHSIVCQWYINGETQPDGDCKNLQLHVSKDAGLNVTCKVASEDRVKAAGSIEAVPEEETLMLVKKIAVYNCEMISSSDQQTSPVPVTCWLRGNVNVSSGNVNVSSDLVLTFHYNGNMTSKPSCTVDDTYYKLTCAGELPGLDDTARVVVMWNGMEMANVPLNTFKQKVDPEGDDWTKIGVPIICVGALIIVAVILGCCWRKKLLPCQRKNGGTGGNGEAAGTGEAAEQIPLSPGGGADQIASGLDETVDVGIKMDKDLLEKSNGNA